MKKSRMMSVGPAAEEFPPKAGPAAQTKRPSTSNPAEGGDSVCGVKGDGLSEVRETPGRYRRLPGDMGWLLVLGGLIGFVAPGILGLDMLALGALILWPGNERRIERWLAGAHPAPKVLRGSIRQVNRFLDDLERRYPRTKAPPTPSAQH